MKKTLCVMVIVCVIGMVFSGCGSRNEKLESEPSENTANSTEIQADITEDQQSTDKASLEETTESAQYVENENQEESATEVLEEELEKNVTQDMAYEGVNNYCHANYDWSVADDSANMYLEMGEETEAEYLVIFHSYTGAIVNFRVDKLSGKTNMSEYVPALDIEDQAGSFSLFDYLN